jgi:hypothetical protein
MSLMRPYSFEFIKDNVIDGTPNFCFNRSDEVQALYEQHKQMHASETLSQFIKQKYFDALTHENTNTNGVMVRNAFPYDIEANITQYVVWALSDEVAQNIVASLKSGEQAHPSKLIWFVNKREDMSVPDVWHCHIFIKQPSLP